MGIAKMTITDYEESYGMWSETSGMGLRAIDDSKTGITTFLKRNPNTNFVYRDKDKLEGVILCGHDGRRGYIYHAVVHENSRKKGIGRKLVEAVIESLEDEGIKKAALVVYSDNSVGNQFWESLGFVERQDLIYRNRAIDKDNK